MDGSEPTGTVAAAVLSGAPTDLQARTVRYGLRYPLTPVFDSLVAYFTTGYTDLRSPLHNPELGIATTGEWTGTYYRKAIAGRIH